MDLQLAGRAALITGGSAGIGFATARRFAAEGVTCALLARTTENSNRAAQALREATGGRVLALTGSTTDTAAVERAVAEAVDVLGGVDVLVNGAARVSLVGGDEALDDIDADGMLRDFDEKVVGYLRVARAVATHMVKQRWGRIINISGSNARLAGKISAGARNIAVVHLTKTLSMELGAFGITVNAVHPHTTLTERVREAYALRAEAMGRSVDDLMSSDGERNAIGRLVTAKEVADLVTYLASPLAAAITGEAIGIGGGFDSAVRV